MLDVKQMDMEILVATIERLEQAYRAGTPEVSDAEFDHVFLAELQRRDSTHPLLDRVGAEGDFGAGKVVHPSPMLSTVKAYTSEEVEAYTRKVHAAALAVGIDPDSLQFRITAKLDGMAARFDGTVLVTRGDGLKGNDITSAIQKGVVMDAPGVGEIVMPTAYFETNLSENLKNPRNVVVGAVGADVVNQDAQEALEAGAIRFVNYRSLHAISCDGVTLIEKLEEFTREVLRETEYPVDGIVIEVEDETVKLKMGANNHHHRWMIAKKTKGEHAIVTVVGIDWSTGRSGRVTPTVVIEPVELSGATITRVVAHHAGNVKAQGIGPGAELRILRSGEVIPFIDEVIKPAESVEIPTQCPACGGELRWERDFIVCFDVNCDAQCIRQLWHFFDILGNLDLFGQKSIEKLVQHGHRDLLTIYGLTAADFEACGFGAKQAENLVVELERSRTDAVEDWRWLGAMGIHFLGRGTARRLLKVHPIHSLNEVSMEDIDAIDGFGSVVAPSIYQDIQDRWPTMEGLLALKFNLVMSQDAGEGVLTGKRVVFTGAMERPRKEMEAEATRLGAEVQKSVSKNTDWLITGNKVGPSKLAKAEKLGVEIVPVADYENRIR